MEEMGTHREDPFVTEGYDHEVVQAAFDIRVIVEKDKAETAGVEEKEENVI